MARVSIKLNSLRGLQNPAAWLRFAWPVAAGFLVIWLVIHIMYFGGPRESLAAKAESEIMRFALRNAVYTRHASAKPVVSFSVSNADLEVLAHAPHPALQDAHIQEYAQVIEYSARFKPRWIVASWLTHAHPMTPEYLQPITSTIDRLKLNDRITLAINLFASGSVDNDFARRYNVVEARDCFHDVNLHCSYSPDWSWMPQQIFFRFLQIPERFMSTNLPHHLPNIMLNLPASKSLLRYRFMDARAPVAGQIPEDAIVFIGNDSAQDVMFRDNKEVLQRTYVAQSNRTRSLQADGIAWHVFWASMSAMLLDQKMIQVAPLWINLVICILAAILIFALAFRKLGHSMFISLTALVAITLLFNYFSVKSFGFYLPVTPIFLTYFISLTAALFLSVAISNYKKWHLLAIARRAEEAGDLKQNFLQLISHNLNTPIAQLKGLLELIVSGKPENASLNQALLLADYVRITSRAALGTSAMTTQAIGAERRLLKDVLDSFLDDEGSFLKRIGAKLLIQSRTDESDGGVWGHPIAFDSDLFSNALLYTIILITEELPSSEISLSTVSLPNTGSSADTIHLALSATRTTESKRDIDPPRFLNDTLRRYLDTAAAIGRINVKINEHRAILTLRDENHQLESDSSLSLQ